MEKRYKKSCDDQKGEVVDDTNYEDVFFILDDFDLDVFPWFVYLRAEGPSNQEEPKAESKSENSSAKVGTANGLRIVTFNTVNGGVIVNLPDDMRAGDTISGTVYPEPKGSTQEERNRNRDVLNGYVVQIADQRFPVNKGSVGPIVIRRLQMPTGPGMAPTENSFFDVFVAIDPNDSAAARARIPLLPSGAVITPDPNITPSFIIPPLGQTGRAIVITGPFDGNAANTSLNVVARRPNGPDFEKNTENVSGGFGLLAESPRKAVFQSPANVAGTITITVKEGNTQTTGDYRNVGVNLTAPKTNLLRGERTELRVDVNGLQGIKDPVPLTLESRGVITMEGGVYQPLVIQPSQVGADGRYTTTRGITGVQTGGWTATATVVVSPFDICLQDDSRPATVFLWNTFTGSYSFFGSDQNLTGAGHVRINGCTIVLEHNASNRHVMSTVDQCMNTGSAFVQIAAPRSPRVRFTITDRNTRDNTCACGPGCK